MTTTINATSPVFLFPGQGGYDGAALKRTYGQSPRVRALFARIDAVAAELFARRLTDLLFPDGEAVEMRRLLDDAPWVSQLAVYGAGLAAYHRLIEHGVRPSALVGHSLGEITALVAAGAYTVEDGARIVARRTELAAEGNCEDGSMVVVGASATRAAHMAGLTEEALLTVAAENHDGQTVLSGPREAIARLRAIGEFLNTAVAPIDSPFAFHNPSLAGVAPRFENFVEGIAQRPLTVPVYSPILGRFYEAGEQLGRPLAEHFTRPVRFAAALRALYGEGARVFVETGGRSALTPMVSKALTGRAREDFTALATLATGRDGADTLERTLATLRDTGLADSPGTETLRALLAPGFSDKEFADFWAAAGHEVLEMVSERASAFLGTRDPRSSAATTGPAAEAPATEALTTEALTTEAPDPSAPPNGTDGTGLPERQEILASVRTLYAQALEYPEEVMTDDALLEAELGVDSVKQVELLGRATELYGLSSRGPDFRLSDYDTLGRVTDLIEDGLRRHQLEGAVA
ncbi:acyltransferase domain-containing protein [Streptomyces griseoloalbus]|uniref:acyltransferase domain-containing protein n=1 Tax=Streptomyces griseoloalbus TaxID=67303 RepID=UPI0033A9EC39